MNSLLTLTTHHPVSVFALLLLMIGFSATASAQWASDGNFNPADWTCTVIPPPMSGLQANAVCSQFTTDGNPPFSRQTFHHYGSPPNSPGVFVAHVYQPSSAIYDPSVQGAIVGLRYNYDLKSEPAHNAAYHLLVFQDSTFYECYDPNPLAIKDDSMLGNNTWSTYPKNPITYSAANCVKLYGPSPNMNPDFSCKGKPIRFGFESGISSGHNDRTSYLDNWKVLVESAPCCGGIAKPTIHCNRSGTGFTYNFEVTNNSTQPTQYILLSPPPGATYTISPSVINTQLLPSSSTPVSVNIANAPPTGNVCIDVLLADEKGRSCCKVKTCLPAPECPCLKVIKGTVECGQGGSYTYTVQLQNLTGTSIQQVFVIPKFPTSVTVTPSVVPVSLGANGGQSTFSVTINNAAPGSTVILLLSPSGDQPLCCSLEIQLTVPKQGQC